MGVIKLEPSEDALAKELTVGYPIRIIGLGTKRLFRQILGKSEDLPKIRITESKNHTLNPVLPR